MIQPSWQDAFERWKDAYEDVESELRGMNAQCDSLEHERDEARALVRQLLPMAQDIHDPQEAEQAVARWDGR